MCLNSEHTGMWMRPMAESLIFEITEQMSGIQFCNVSTPGSGKIPEPRVVVYGLIGGDYTMHVWLLAERRFFCRLAKNMMGEVPEEEDIRDYAVEYFNILCGRFVSEIVNEMHISARLFPIKYEIPSEHTVRLAEEPLHTLNFISDANEQASFSWTAIPSK